MLSRRWIEPGIAEVAQRKIFYHFLFHTLCLSLTAPVLLLFTAWYTVDGELWQHVVQHLLPDIVLNSALLLVGTNICTTLLGVTAAALVTLTNLPGRKIFQSIFIFPFVVPPYVFGFIYLSVFDSAGFLQNFLRIFFSDFFVNIRNVGGLIVVLSLALFPYVYLFCRQAFLSQGRRLLEVAKTLGHKPLACFFLSSCLWPVRGFTGR